MELTITSKFSLNSCAAFNLFSSLAPASTSIETNEVNVFIWATASRPVGTKGGPILSVSNQAIYHFQILLRILLYKYEAKKLPDVLHSDARYRNENQRQ